jgi:hypothetical protein
MQKRPRLRVVKEDSTVIAIKRVIIGIGSSRYAMEISAKCTELKPVRAQIIPIDRYVTKGPS